MPNRIAADAYYRPMPGLSRFLTRVRKFHFGTCGGGNRKDNAVLISPDLVQADDEIGAFTGLTLVDALVGDDDRAA